MGEAENPEDFSLLGGPLHRLGWRLGLIRGRTNTVALGLVLGLLAWFILLVLASIQGTTLRLFAPLRNRWARSPTRGDSPLPPVRILVRSPGQGTQRPTLIIAIVMSVTGLLLVFGIVTRLL
jgi:hypothetical protein